MKRSLLAVALAVAVAATLVALTRPSAAQDARGQRAQIIAAIDITPIQKEIAALRADLAALRAAVADAEGLRGDLAKATKAVKDMDEHIAELAETVGAFTKATQPVIQALKPPLRWQYRVLRSRSESVANRLGRDGWELVVGYEEGLFFKRPAPAPEKPED